METKHMDFLPAERSFSHEVIHLGEKNTAGYVHVFSLRSWKSSVSNTMYNVYCIH